MATTSSDLGKTLWGAADVLRQKMSADAYKDYLLGLVFYKALSDKYLIKVVDLIENKKDVSLEEAQKLYEDTAQNSEDWKILCEELQKDMGCIILPEHTFTAFYNQINEGSFLLENLSQAFRNIEQSHGNHYDGLFDDFDISSKDLGKNVMECNKMISSVIKALEGIDFSQYSDDALGDAYEYLIGQFASESGKKAGEFYISEYL